MQPNTKNGVQTTAHEMLESLRLAIERLEAEVKRQGEEIEGLRAERDEYRAVVLDHLKKKFGDPKLWDDFDEKDYTLTLDDLLATIHKE